MTNIEAAGRRCHAMAAALVLTFAAATACSSSSLSTSAPQSAGSDGMVAAERAVQVLYKGTDRSLPASGPAAQKGKNVWVISCYQAAPGCATPAAGVASAATSLGWRITITDAKLDPKAASDQIRSAVAAKADAVIVDGFPCAWAPGALAQAKSAGVKIYGLNSDDCNSSGGSKLFDAEALYGKGSYRAFLRDQVGGGIAQYVIAKTKGKGKILALDYNDGGAVETIHQGFAATIKSDCPDCTLNSFAVTGQAIAQNQVQSLTASALTHYPNTDVVMSPVDSLILLGMGSAVTQAEATGKKILLTGVEGFAPNLNLIATGKAQSFAIGSPARWSGWAAADGLNRVFAGAPQVDPGIGLQAIDKDHPSPSGLENYNGNARSQGYESNYKRIWAG